MAVEVEDLLRLAWEADGNGRPGMRDALLTTLVVAESGADDAVLAEQLAGGSSSCTGPNTASAATATLGMALRRL